MSFTRFTQPMQTKLHQFCHSFADHFSRPENKFIRQMVFGILKGGSVQINTIARSLQEKISLKKTAKRLGTHLASPGLWQEVSHATLDAQASRLRKCRFVIIDPSDICKDYAEQMEGIATVYDGSEKELGHGYALCDLTVVDDDAQTIIPIYSELFSHLAEVTSENEKILNATETVMPYCDPEAICVHDRGGDREILLNAHLEAGRQFIARQTGARHLFYQGQEHSFDFLTRKTRLRWAYTIERVHKNKVRKRTYDCGAVRVRLDANGKSLWLVVMKGRHGGYCWLLCYFKNCHSAQEAVALALKGYGLRWKIEEVHRQIKVDYHLEAICLQRYEALKTMNALLWMAVSFLYTRLESLAIEIIFHPELALVNRKRPKDVLRFIYYKLALAFKKIMAIARLYDKIVFTQPDRQLTLTLNEPMPVGVAS